MMRLVLGCLAVALMAPFAAPTAADAKALPWFDACPCEWRSPGVFWRDRAEFIECAIQATRAARTARTITRRQARRAIRTARRSVPCGDPTFTLEATCGGPDRRACIDPDYYCSYVGTGVCADGRWGYCVARACSPVGDTSPVCGCDGKTYAGYCLALESGAEVAHFGACVQPTQ